MGEKKRASELGLESLSNRGETQAQSAKRQSRRMKLPIAKVGHCKSLEAPCIKSREAKTTTPRKLFGQGPETEVSRRRGLACWDAGLEVA